MFVKFKRHLVEARAEATVAAAKLAQWEDQRWWQDRERRMRKGKRGTSFCSSSNFPTHPPGGSPLSTTGVDIVMNAYVNDPATHKVPLHGSLLVRGRECFDSESYLSANPELSAALPQDDPAAAWSHALHHGQFGLRPMAFRCSAFAVADGIATAAAALTAKGSIFSLSEKAKKAFAAREATRLAAAAAGGRETIASAADQ